MGAIANESLHAPRLHRTRIAVGAGAVAAVVAFMTGPLLFVPSPDVPTPTGVQLPFFIGLAAVESLIFGLGVAVAVAGRRVVARLFTTPARATAVHLAVTWALISWWPHDGLHMTTGLNLNGLLGIEYGFHITLMIAAAIVVWAFVAQERDARG